MIFEYLTQTFGEDQYLMGSRLVSERGKPKKDYEFPESFKRPLLADGQPRWIINDNPEYDPEVDKFEDRYLIEEKPLPLTAVQLEVRQSKLADKQLRSPETIRDLLARIEALEQKYNEMKELSQQK